MSLDAGCEGKNMGFMLQVVCWRPLALAKRVAQGMVGFGPPRLFKDGCMARMENMTTYIHVYCTCILLYIHIVVVYCINLNVNIYIYIHTQYIYIYVYIYAQHVYLFLLEFDLPVGILLFFFKSWPDSWLQEVFSNSVTWYDLLAT